MKRSVRGLVSQLVPPAAIQLARRVAPRRFAAPAPPVHCTGRFSSYAEASARAVTYADPRIADGVLAKTLAYRAQLAAEPLVVDAAVTRMAIVLALVGADRAELRALDVGGALGSHYQIARRLLPASVGLRWHVVETPEMVARGAALASDELHFFTELDVAREALDTVDLLYCDGVLHALPDPLDYLDRLLACDARHLALLRVGTSDATTFTILNLPLSAHEPEIPLPSEIADVPTSLPLACATPAAIEDRIRTRYAIRATLPTQSYRFDALTLAIRSYICARSPSSGQSRQ